ncbi:MAG TPA: DNA polymerase III subunit gamma/tau, partial [Myxococcaceae bacterium]|nr:DNA polymerase III subunit gamma/tau [Myxococcaceae bacterium]
LVQRDASRLLTRIDEMFNRGVELKKLAEEVALRLRHLFVAKALGEAPVELPDVERKAVLALAKEADAAQLARLFDVLFGAIADIGYASQPKLAMEMAALKAIHLAPAGALPDLVARLERLGASSASPKMNVGASGGRSEPAPFRA